MSDIPEARRLLKAAMCSELDVWAAVDGALKLLDRKKPAFVAPRRVRALSDADKNYARHLRKAGMAQHEIAIKLKTNGGRISEAINEED